MRESRPLRRHRFPAFCARAALIVGFVLGGRSAVALDFELVPVGASGVEGVDWMLGPGPNEIQLAHGGQNIEIEVYFSGFAPAAISTYQATLDCMYDFSLAGGVLPVAVGCLEGEFGAAQCTGVDATRPDFLFNGFPTVHVCNLNDTCDDGSPGRFACGAAAISAEPFEDEGTPYYAMTYAFIVEAGAAGVLEIGLDFERTPTFAAGLPGKVVVADDVVPAIVTVGETCVGDGACDDANACTDDACVESQCVNTDNTPSGYCCNPGNGSLTEIDDDNPCTMDVCRPDGSVTHAPSAAGTACDDGERCTAFDECDGAGRCAGADVNGMACSDISECPAGTESCEGGFCVCPDACKDSVVGGNVHVGLCLTQVPNRFVEFGCTMQDLIDRCEDARNLNTPLRKYYECLRRRIRRWHRIGIIDGEEALAIERCVRDSLP